MNMLQYVEIYAELGMASCILKKIPAEDFSLTLANTDAWCPLLVAGTLNDEADDSSNSRIVKLEILNKLFSVQLFEYQNLSLHIFAKCLYSLKFHQFDSYVF